MNKIKTFTLSSCLAILFASILLCGCSSPPAVTPKPDPPKTPGSVVADANMIPIFNSEDGAAIMKASRDYVAINDPKAIIKGIAIDLIDPSCCLVNIDEGLSIKHYIAWNFVASDASSYWKIGSASQGVVLLLNRAKVNNDTNQSNNDDARSDNNEASDGGDL